ENQAQAFALWQRYDPHFGGNNCGQGPFATGENFGQIIRRTGEAFERVTAPSFLQTGRHSFRDFWDRLPNELCNTCMFGGEGCVARPNRLDPAIREDDFERTNMVGCCAVNRTARTRRVVGDHPADRRPRAGRNVWPETKTMWLQKSVQLIEHDSGAHPYSFLIKIEIRDLTIEARKIDDQSVA